ncbi:hypothetical protein Scep_014545 [Stephania cephalantha]|uniref:Uncharacterized protein n=1 Tax=Stephania cephalantha TaxID=152367 RepID=A0AAP0J1F9_9MAGN
MLASKALSLLSSGLLVQPLTLLALYLCFCLGLLNCQNCYSGAGAISYAVTT